MRDGLEFTEDMRFQRWIWTLQRCGWVVLVGLSLLGLLGVIARGPLSRVQTQSRGGELAAHFDRVLHVDAPAQVSIRAAPQGESLSVGISKDYFMGINVGRIVPIPSRTIADGSQVTLVFETIPSAAEQVVILHLEPAQSGWHRARISAAGESVEFTQLALP